MKLNTSYSTVEITEKDLGLEEKINISVKILTYKENIELMSKHDIKENSSEIKMLDYAKDIFVKSVVKWSGIEDNNGKPLECNVKNKSAIFDFNPDFAESIITKAAEKIEDNKKKL